MTLDPASRPEETRPTPTASTDIAESTPARGLVWRRLRWFLLALPVAALAAGLVGYSAGGQEREAARQRAIAEIAAAQFASGLTDLEAGRYELARQRFEYILRLDPTYPNAIERLAQALVAIGGPIATSAPLPTATPNLAPVEDLFAQAQQAFSQEDWTLVIETLLALRAKDPTYQAIEADGMLYVALRNRGLHYIRNDWELELGLYDLARAERFGPLDKEAEDWRASARYYLQANTYLGLNWGAATEIFLDICAPAALWDSCDKLSLSAERYADGLKAMGDPCAALDEVLARELPQDYPALQPIYSAIDELEARCAALHPPPPPPTETPTPTPEGGGEPTPAP